MLCYARHVCNYYVKVFEWFCGLLAVFRDKRWFLVKRRRSMRESPDSMRQKKPTTANRQQLEAAIAVVLESMPHVHKGSEVLPSELAKFPVEGEQDMLEQAESTDLTGDLKIDRELLCAWMTIALSQVPLRLGDAAIRQGPSGHGDAGRSHWRRGLGALLSHPVQAFRCTDPRQC